MPNQVKSLLSVLKQAVCNANTSYVGLPENVPELSILQEVRRRLPPREGQNTHLGINIVLNSNSENTYGSGTGDCSGETPYLYIGDDGSGGYYWKGYIDDVQIYSRVLSTSEVTELYGSY